MIITCSFICRQYQELMIKQFQFLNKNMKLSFRVSFHRTLPQPKYFSLNINIFGFKMQTYSQSISFLAEMFAMAIQITRAFLAKLCSSRSSKIFFSLGKYFLVSGKLFFLPVEKCLKQTPALSQLVFSLKKKQASSQKFLIIYNGNKIIPPAKLFYGFFQIVFSDIPYHRRQNVRIYIIYYI